MSYRSELALVIERADIVEEICSHIANGGDLITFAQANRVRYSDVVGWLNGDKERARQYGLALVARDEWMAVRLLNELRAIGESDLRDAYAADGSLLAPKDWPEGLARAIASIEVEELFEYSRENGKEKVGELKKIKLWPKIEALKLQMQKLGMLVERKQMMVTFDVSTRMAELEEARRRALEAALPAPDPQPVIETATIGPFDPPLEVKPYTVAKIEGITVP